MGDQSKATFEQPEAGQQPAGSDQTPQYLTKDEARKLKEEAVKEAEERAFRRAQGYYESEQTRVRERLNGLEQVWKMQEAAGVQLTDEQKNQIKQRTIQEAMTEQPSTVPGTPPPAQAPGQQPAGNAPPHPVTEMAWDMMDKAGVEIIEGDPEFQTLDYTDKSLFLMSVANAISAKKQRLSSAGTPPVVQGQAQPQRTPTNAGGTGAGSGLEAQYRAELANTPVANKEQILQIRAKYRRLGLNL